MVHTGESELALMLAQQTLDPLSHPQPYSGIFLRQNEKDAMLHQSINNKGNIGPRADRQLWGRWPCTSIFCVRLQRSLHKVVALSRVLLGVCVMLLFLRRGYLGLLF